jgi:hypothetical protein
LDIVHPIRRISSTDYDQKSDYQKSFLIGFHYKDPFQRRSIVFSFYTIRRKI